MTIGTTHEFDVAEEPAVVDAHSYTRITLARLHMISLGLCLNPDCRERLLSPREPRQPFSAATAALVADVAHIHSPNPGGPRHAADMTVDELRSYPNLLLLCPRCHRKVDGSPDLYPADALRAWKAVREQEAPGVLAGHPSLLATVVDAITREAAFDQSPGSADSLLSYEVTDKIDQNHMVESSWLVREYAVFQAPLLALYAELEQHNPVLKTGLLRFVAQQYQLVKNGFIAARRPTDQRPARQVVAENSDEIFGAVHAALVDLVLRARPGLPWEQASFGVLIVTVDAFLACKVMEPPR